jgi:L-lactate utilization protein LutC
MISLFAARLTEAGGKVAVLDSVNEVAPWIAENCRLKEGANIAVSCQPLLRETGLARALKQLLPSAIVLEEHDIAPADLREHIMKLAGTDIGIDVALAGFADCGAIAIRSSRDESRLLTLLPETHIAILPREMLYPTLPSYAHDLAELLTGEKPAAVTLIGGPSKTADIEKVLVQGVHGPGNLTVLIV